METAVAAIKAAAPAAEVTSADDARSMVVTITAPAGTSIWSGDQRGLYRKYASRRDASIAAIQAAVKAHLK